MHIQNKAMRRWLIDAMESTRNRLDLPIELDRQAQEMAVPDGDAGAARVDRKRRGPAGF